MEKYYCRIVNNDLSAVLERWREFSVTLGREVLVNLGGRTVRGRALDINEAGALQVMTAEGVETFLAGEVTLQAKMNNKEC